MLKSLESSAWLGESVNTNAGLGFNGYDDRGVARWDLIDNADIAKVEVWQFFSWWLTLTCSCGSVFIFNIYHFIYYNILLFNIYHFSGPNRALSLEYVFVCIQSITFEPNDH